MEEGFKTKIQEALSSEAGKLAAARSLHILRIDVRGTAQNPVIEVVLDGPKGVTVGDCESVSKDLNAAIETHTLIKGNFRLDVMSPGVEEPLEHDWQFERSMDRLIEAHYEDAGEHHTVHGTLRGFDKESISLEPIHVGSRKEAKAMASGLDGLPLKEDEQLYEKQVALVRIERKHLKKVLVTLQFKR